MKTKVIVSLLLISISLSGCSAIPNKLLNTKVPEVEITIPDLPVDDFSQYTLINGVLTFRGNQTRTAPSFGTANIKEKSFEKMWSVTTTKNNPTWGGGSGWTGQPALVQWPQETKEVMNIDPKYVNDDDFVEVIIGSLNGKIYFLDLATGEQTRQPIDLKDPIKGSVSIDSRGWPLMYVGQGIKESDELGFYLISLIDQKVLFFQNGNDPAAPKNWPAFDSSALFDREKDRLIVGGENGLVYRLDLNTNFSPEEGTLTIDPKINRFKYANTNGSYGIENSLTKYKDYVYFADNGGTVTCLNIETMKAVWTYKNLDDTDSSTIVEVVDDIPYVYTICQIDKQGAKGTCRIVKLNGLTGETVWKNDYPAFSRDGASPSNGGGLGTPILGKGDLEGMVFFNICRAPEFSTGYTIAFDTKTGKEIWKKKTTDYNWPSPVDIYDDNGKGYIIQVSRSGVLWLIDGKTGEDLASLKVDSYMEASPAVFNDMMVFASRTPGNKFYGVKIK